MEPATRCGYEVMQINEFQMHLVYDGLAPHFFVVQPLAEIEVVLPVGLLAPLMKKVGLSHFFYKILNDMSGG